MSLHQRDGFVGFVAALPGTSLVEQWESLVAKVGGKVFCTLGNNSGHIDFKVAETSFEGLTALDGIGQAAYFAKRQWVAVTPGALAEAELEAYLRESYKLVAAKLTKKARAEHGITL